MQRLHRGQTSRQHTVPLFWFQERARTLEELYLQASRAAELREARHRSAAALCSLQEMEAAELAAAPPPGYDDAACGGGSDAGLLQPDPPRVLVPALQQLAALRRERDALAKQARAML